MLRTKVTYSPNKRVQRAAVDAAERVGKKFGSYVMRSARQSIRKPNKSGEPARPGQPPKDRSGALKGFILFAYDKQDRSVVIGPSLLPGRTDAPEALERGKRTVRRVFQGRKRVRKAVTYEARPFMVPALEKRLPELLGLWSNQIK